MASRIFPALLAAAVCCTAGCEIFGAEVEPTIQPLAVGSTWTFADSVFGATVAVSELTISIPGTITLPAGTAGQRREVFRWQVAAGGTVLRTNLVDVEDGDFWHHGVVMGTDTLLLRTPWARYPVAPGDTFQEQRYTYDAHAGTFTVTDTWTWRCLRTDEPMTVGGRTFHAVVFSTTPDARTENWIYYIPDVGYAGWMTRVDGATVFREHLVAYDLK